MPLYELALIIRPLAKVELVEALKACCSRLIEDGAIISKIESLGYRDLPFKMRKLGQPKQITGNYLIFNLYAPEATMNSFRPFVKQNTEVLHHHALEVVPTQPPEECSLHEELKPPAYRKSVQELRAKKRMDRLTRWIAVLTARNWAKREPKSYFVAPFRE